MLVDFAEAPSLNIMNAFFKNRLEQKWTWKSPSDVKNEIDHNFRRDIIINVVINKVNVGSDHRMVRGEIKVHLGRERNKLIRKLQPNLGNLKIRATEFSLNIQNKYSLLDDAALKSTNSPMKVSSNKDKTELV
ncbi:uncharacterized protein [Penaeus vannamei]|uniref:uncharacterized protein n=1 Tax=Penaeus vannamei TaxID=6689 RepID=UPI00387F874E